MSHTMVGSCGTRFHFDGGLEGDVRIFRDDEWIIVPAADLVELVVHEWLAHRAESMLDALMPKVTTTQRGMPE